MNELEYKWDSPDKHIPVGTLVRFVDAPPRFKGEDWRNCGGHLEGKTAIVLSGPIVDVGGHQWGGRFTLHSTGHGCFDYYGDFLEIIG